MKKMVTVQRLRLVGRVLTSVATLTVFFVSVNVGFDATLPALQAIAIVWSTYIIVIRHRHVYVESDVNYFNQKAASPMLWVVAPLLLVMFVASCVGYLEFFSYLTDRKLDYERTFMSGFLFHCMLMIIYVGYSLLLLASDRRLS